jgi:type II secretory pathway pseudopilin PulG
MRMYFTKESAVTAVGNVTSGSNLGRSNRQAAGFTLAEVVFAIVLVTIGAAGLMSCFSYGFKVIGQIRENQRATQIMMEKAETLRLYSWDQVNTSGFIPSTFTATYDGDTVASNYTGTVYSGTVTIGPFPYNTSYKDKMRKLDLTVRWNSQNISRTRSVTTYVAKDGIQNYVY